MNSKFVRSSSTTCLTLEQGCPVLFDEQGIWSRTLSTFDEGVDIVHNPLLQTLWRNPTFESCTWAFSASTCSQFVQDVLKDVILISIHVADHLGEVPEYGVCTLDHYLRLRQSPTSPFTDLGGNPFARPVEQFFVFELGHSGGPPSPSFRSLPKEEGMFRVRRTDVFMDIGCCLILREVCH